MKFLFFTEDKKVLESTVNVLHSSSHVITHMDLTELTGLDNLDNFDGIIVDKKNWHRCSAMMKYFGVMDLLNTKPLMILSNVSKGKTLKFRDSQEKSISCGYPITLEDFNFAVDKLFSTQVEAQQV